MKIFNDVNEEGEHELTIVMSCEYGKLLVSLLSFTSLPLRFISLISPILLPLHHNISSSVTFLPVVLFLHLAARTGIRRRHRFIYQSCDIVSAMFDDTACNCLRVMPKVRNSNFYVIEQVTGCHMHGNILVTV